MEEVKGKLKEEFKKDVYKTRDNKLAYAIGYLEDCERVNRKEAILIIRAIFFEEL